MNLAPLLELEKPEKLGLYSQHPFQAIRHITQLQRHSFLTNGCVRSAEQGIANTLPVKKNIHS